MSDNAISESSQSSLLARIGLSFLAGKFSGDDNNASHTRSSKKGRGFHVGRARWITLAMLAALMTIRVLDPSVLELLRLKTFDLYQQIKPRPIMANSPVVIIDLDEESLREIGQWPWPRDENLDGLT